MSNVRGMFAEISMSSFLIVLFDAMITGILVFSFFYLVLNFFRVTYLYAFALAVVIFIYSFIMKLRRNKILEIETKYPELKERLRTSRDYKDSENMVVLSLHHEVLRLIDKVDVNAFLNLKKLFLKVGAISLVLFAVVILSVYNIDFFSITGQVKGNPLYDRLKSGFTGDKIQVQETTDYMKDGKIADLGNDQLNLSLNVYNTELDMDQIDNPEKNDYGGSFPTDVSGYAQESFNEKISDEYKDTIRNYFKKINR